MAETKTLLQSFQEFAEDLEKRSLWYTRLPGSLQAAFAASASAMTRTIQPREFVGYRARPHTPRCSPPRPLRPFRVEQMMNPPHEVARSSRLNTMGKSRLYLASRPDIAVVECHAVAGDFVTVCEFHLEREVKFFDFRRLARNQNPEVRELYESISRSCASPVDQSKGEVAEYLLTQWFAEYLQWELAFDGLIYATATYGRGPDAGGDLENGKAGEDFNLCSFYPDQWRAMPDSLRVLNVTGQNVVTREVRCPSPALGSEGSKSEGCRVTS